MLDANDFMDELDSRSDVQEAYRKILLEEVGDRPEASRKLDAQVAEICLGIRVVRNWPCGYDCVSGEYLAAISRDFAEKYPWSYPEKGPVYFPENENGRLCPEPLPYYSNCIKACLPIIVKYLMTTSYWGQPGSLKEMDIWSASASRKSLGEEHEEYWWQAVEQGMRPDLFGSAETMALAICRAALNTEKVKEKLNETYRSRRR